MKVIGFAKILDIDTPHYIATSYRNDDNSGEYVSLAEYQELRRLLERVDAIAPNLADEYSYANQTPELTQLLSDIKEALS